MVPPDGARTKRIPALSWDSVVDSGRVGDDDLDPGDAGAVDLDEIAFEPMHLDSVPDRETTLAPPPSPPIPARPTPAPEVVQTAIVEEPVTVRVTPPAVIVPAIGDVTSGPDQLAPAAIPVATPSTAPTPTAPSTEAVPQILEATPVFAPVGPSLPSVAPAVHRPAVATSFEFDPASVSPVLTRRPQRHGKRRGVRLVATLVVLGGLVAAGVVFGRSYLYPGEWDSATAPYADAVESGRSVDFVEPLAIVAESTGDFDTRLGTQLAVVSADELVQWRALGLASGTVDDATLASQLAGWQDALYSTVDGQVYHDLGVVGDVLDAQLVQEMTAASLDQEFGWSVEQPRRTLDAAAATSAEVLRQSRSLQRSSAFDTEVPPVSIELAGTLPPVIGYRMLAPHVFAEFDASIEPGDRTNPLADPAGDGDGVTAPALTQDHSFWYLVFAGYLDARTAFAASEAVVESALTSATRGATQCSSATFSGGGVEQTATLRSTLTAWAAATPAEMSSSFQVLPDGTLQLVSCDPGAGFDAAVRPGVARELLAWRMAELATKEAVRVGGGGEAQLVDAWAFVQASPVAIDLAALPSATTPPDLAAAAQDAVNALFTPAG